MRNIRKRITRIFAGEQAMLSVLTLAPNAKGKVHSHPEEQWGIMLEGDGVRTLKAGPKGGPALDVFAPPRDEYRKPGPGFRANQD